MSELSLTLDINGTEMRIGAEARTTVIDVLRGLGLTGAKRGCNQGVCGACAVLMDGRVVQSCLALAALCEGRAIRTIEGFTENGVLSALQQSFIDHGAVQCGFCTPGMIVAAAALLAEKPRPSLEDIREGLSGNLCRCTGYVKIVAAVAAAARAAS